MPTAARLVALFCLAGLGWFMAELVEPLLIADERGGVWAAGFMLAGAYVGWMGLGIKVGVPAHKSAFLGMGAVIHAFVIILGMSTLYACYDAMGYHAYRTLEDLMGGLTKNFLDYLSYARDPMIVGYAILGGGISGIIAEMTHRTWR